MRVQPHASHFPIVDPYRSAGSLPSSQGGSAISMPGSAPDKHPSPAIGFLIAGIFGMLVWTAAALLLL